MIQPQAPPVDPLPPNRAESLELAKSYREFARYYFTVRSNASYLNIVAAGTFTYFFAQRLVDTPGESIVSALTSGYWMYAVGCIAFIAFALWAMSICNLLSNAFFSYMLLTRDLEKGLGVTYPQKRWAVTFEFLSEAEQDKEGRKDVTGNVWNFLNAFLVLYGLYSLCLISLLSSQWVMLILGTVAFGYGYYRLVKFVADVEADKARTWYRKDQFRLWVALAAFLSINAWFLLGLDTVATEPRYLRVPIHQWSALTSAGTGRTTVLKSIASIPGGSNFASTPSQPRTSTSSLISRSAVRRSSACER